MNATHKPLPAEAEIEALTGHRFPGGTYCVPHWENFLLTGCTGAQILPDGMLHPVVLFHLPIAGAGTSIAEMFALGQAESNLSIMIESYDWEIFNYLHEETLYQIEGQIISAKRCKNDAGQAYDRLQFRFEVFSPDQQLAARTTITWHYTRNML